MRRRLAFFKGFLLLPSCNMKADKSKYKTRVAKKRWNNFLLFFPLNTSFVRGNETHHLQMHCAFTRPSSFFSRMVIFLCQRSSHKSVAVSKMIGLPPATSIFPGIHTLFYREPNIPRSKFQRGRKEESTSRAGHGQQGGSFSCKEVLSVPDITYVSYNGAVIICQVSQPSSWDRKGKAFLFLPLCYVLDSFFRTKSY